MSSFHFNSAPFHVPYLHLSATGFQEGLQWLCRVKDSEAIAEISFEDTAISGLAGLETSVLERRAARRKSE